MQNMHNMQLLHIFTKYVKYVKYVKHVNHADLYTTYISTHRLASLNNSILAGKLLRGNGARRTMVELAHAWTCHCYGPSSWFILPSSLTLILTTLSPAPPIPTAPNFLSLSRA